MKAFLIDTPNKTIEEIDFDNSDYRNVYPLIRAECFELVYINGGKDFVYVDEEGLINGNPHGWFYPAGHHQPLRGYGLVVGADEYTSGTKAPDISLDDLRLMITFPSDEEVVKLWGKG